MSITILMTALAQTIATSSGALPQLSPTQPPEIFNRKFAQNDPGDDCASLNPPDWCVWQVKPDGRLLMPGGRSVRDWSKELEKFREKNLNSSGPVIKDLNGNQYRLQIK